jgi:hypothetical protein
MVDFSAPSIRPDFAALLDKRQVDPWFDGHPYAR